MKVLKFGGTSVGTPESLRNVKRIVEGIDSQTVVVVSALGGITDRLIATARLAAADNPAFREEMERIAARHFNVIEQVVDEGAKGQTRSEVARLLENLRRIFEGISLIRHLPTQTLDLVVSFGERMSSVIVTSMIKGAKRFDSLSFIKTEEWFGKNVADQKLTTDLIKDTFNVSFDKAIVPGFISTDRDSGIITNLGRGGSDFTAALVAAALDASVLEIWTDVDGFMTADPRLIPNARVVDRMSFVESMELCTYGAKVIYPPTIYPVFHKNIPIRILNTFKPEAPGTFISDSERNEGFSIKGVSVLRGTSLFSLASEMASDLTDVETRTFNALARQGIRLYPVSSPGNRGVNFAVSSEDEAKTRSVIISEFAPDIPDRPLLNPVVTDKLSTLAVVGDNLKDQPRLGARIRNSLERAGLKVCAFSDGMSDSTLTFMLPREEADDALRIVHALVAE